MTKTRALLSAHLGRSVTAPTFLESSMPLTSSCLRRQTTTKEELVALTKLTNADFKREVEDADGRVVVDFYADWCGPCHQVAPALEELASKWEGTVRFVKVDIDENPDLAQKYGVFSIPTIALFEDGEVATQTLGARPAHAIEHALGLAAGHAA
jgi:thioredoxin 1